MIGHEKWILWIGMYRANGTLPERFSGSSNWRVSCALFQDRINYFIWGNNRTNFLEGGTCRISLHISNKLFWASLTPSTVELSTIFLVISRLRCVTTNWKEKKSLISLQFNSTNLHKMKAWSNIACCFATQTTQGNQITLYIQLFGYLRYLTRNQCEKISHSYS